MSRGPKRAAPAPQLCWVCERKPVRSVREIAAELAATAAEYRVRLDVAEGESDERRHLEQAGASGAFLGLARRLSAELALLGTDRPRCTRCAWLDEEQTAALHAEGRAIIEALFPPPGRKAAQAGGAATTTVGYVDALPVVQAVRPAQVIEQGCESCGDPARLEVTATPSAKGPEGWDVRLVVVEGVVFIKAWCPDCKGEAPAPGEEVDLG